MSKKERLHLASFFSTTIIQTHQHSSQVMVPPLAGLRGEHGHGCTEAPAYMQHPLTSLSRCSAVMPTIGFIFLGQALCGLPSIAYKTEKVSSRIYAL